MSYPYKCPNCGSYLDPDEICDCRYEDVPEVQSNDN